MTDNKIHTFVLFCFFVIVLGLFCYFRIKPLQFQTVPYTYDQGRDFLKAQEIIHDRHLTFIGPTTGINGVFHGVWWFYLLTIPFIIFGGNPIGFYYFVFFLALVQTLLFCWFLKREFNAITSLLFFLMAATSPYFISLSFFSSNSILTLPFILLFFASTYYFFKFKQNKYLFLLFLSIGFIFESELAFGIFIIPALLLTIIATKNIRLFFKGKKKIPSAIMGLLIPMLPRILFELKNHFTQTKGFIYFLQHPTTTNVVTLKGAILDRITMFAGYYKGIIFQNNPYLGYLLTFISLAGVFFIVGKLKKNQQRFVIFNFFMLVSLFLITLINHSNFFWGNYLEGLSYFYLLLVVMAIYAISISKNTYLKIAIYGFVVWLLTISTISVYADYTRNRPADNVGLRVQEQIVRHIYDIEKQNKFCVIIYTPPVIPFTYNYLFDYYARVYKTNSPDQTYVNNSCWFIIESDDNNEREQKWLDENVPKNGEKSFQYNANNFAQLFKITKNGH